MFETISDADIPAVFWTVPYRGECFPARDIEHGANCQAFAYALLRHFGRHIGNLRSSNLWQDTQETEHVTELAPLDLVLFNRTSDPHGAHVGVYLGEGRVIHLSKRVGKPAIWPLERFARESGYEVFLGAKRVLRSCVAPISS